MHYLKKEFDRLCKYAKGLGVKVTFSNDKKSKADAAWVTDGSEIILYNKSNRSTLSSCLDFYHELAHHMAWVHSGRKGNLTTDKILDKEAEGKNLTELQRKHIFDMESSDSLYQELIHKEIGSKIPLFRLRAGVDLDLWIYRYFWKHNSWPTMRQRQVKKTQFIKKRKERQ